MKRIVRDQARSLLHACMHEGVLQLDRVRQAAELVREKKPRHALHILIEFERLVAFEIERNTLKVETAQPLGEQESSYLDTLESKVGKALYRECVVNPQLIGGVKIQKGFDVWDESVIQKIKQLESSIG